MAGRRLHGDGLVHIGFGGYLSKRLIVAIAPVEAAPIRRFMREVREQGVVIDMTRGRRTQSVILMMNGTVVLAPLTPLTIATRMGWVSERAGEV